MASRYYKDDDPVPLISEVIKDKSETHPDAPAYSAGPGYFAPSHPLGKNDWNLERRFTASTIQRSKLQKRPPPKKQKPPSEKYGLRVELFIPQGRAHLTYFEVIFNITRKVFEHLKITVSVAAIETFVEKYDVHIIGSKESGHVVQGRKYVFHVKENVLEDARKFQDEANQIVVSGRPGVHGSKAGQKFLFVIQKAFEGLGPEYQERLQELCSQKNITLMVGFAAIFAAAQLTPVTAVIANVALVGIVGKEAFDLITLFKNFIFYTGFANKQTNYDVAIKSLKEFLLRAGIDALLAILTKGVVKGVKSVKGESKGPHTVEEAVSTTQTTKPGSNTTSGTRTESNVPSPIPAPPVSKPVIPPKVGMTPNGQKAVTHKTLEHVFHGDVNKGGKGFHYEGAEMQAVNKTKIVKIIKTPDKNGVYVGKVEVKGVTKKAPSSFFPKTWSKNDVVNAINEAYINKIPTGKPNQFEGISSSGVKIQMYLNPDGTIATAYPLYGK